MSATLKPAIRSARTGFPGTAVARTAPAYHFPGDKRSQPDKIPPGPMLDSQYDSRNAFDRDA